MSENEKNLKLEHKYGIFKVVSFVFAISTDGV